MKTILEQFGGDTKEVWIKKLNGQVEFYSLHQRTPDDFVERKDHLKINWEGNLRDICRDLDIDHKGDEDETN